MAIKKNIRFADFMELADQSISTLCEMLEETIENMESQNKDTSDLEAAKEVVESLRESFDEIGEEHALVLEQDDFKQYAAPVTISEKKKKSKRDVLSEMSSYIESMKEITNTIIEGGDLLESMMPAADELSEHLTSMFDEAEGIELG